MARAVPVEANKSTRCRRSDERTYLPVMASLMTYTRTMVPNTKQNHSNISQENWDSFIPHPALDTLSPMD